VIAALLVAAPAAVRAEDQVSLSMRGGGLVRDDHGYGEHASAFGFGDPQLAGGGVVEAGVRVAPRLWLLASWAGFGTSAVRRDSELVVSQVLLVAQLGFTAYRHSFDLEVDDEHESIALALDLVAGGGVTTLSDDLDGTGDSTTGPVARSGAQLKGSWRGVGVVLAYGYHYSRAALVDRLGGRLGAGGHEVSGGVAFGF
jgi:hypothetical protein